jgi:endoglucanase
MAEKTQWINREIARKEHTNSMNFAWLKELCALPGVSGREQEVRAWLTAHLPAGARHETDALGNLIVNRQTGGVMLCAHMDEVGLLITDITEDGLLRVAHVGGVDPAAYLGKQVLVGAAQLPGVVGLPPVHLLEGEAQHQIPKPEALAIDIGTANKAQAQALVRRGEFACFAPGFLRFGDGDHFIKSKALDDRVGCLILLELLHENPEMCAVFSAREEVGGAAACAAFALEPKAAIILETTTAADLPGVAGAARVCALGKGAVVPFMDGGTVYPFALYTLALRLAEQNGILVQTKSKIAGGNDARGIHVSRSGVPVITVSVPCRNLHSPSVVMRADDALAVHSLVKLLWKELSAP